MDVDVHAILSARFANIDADVISLWLEFLFDVVFGDVEERMDVFQPGSCRKAFDTPLRNGNDVARRLSEIVHSHIGVFILKNNIVRFA